MSIEVRGITKTFGAFTALSNINLEVSTGELVALLGPSGSGKTTLLRIIAGLEASDSGSVLFDGEDATRQRVRDRGVGFVFQHYALFRHMSVFDNVAFGLRVRPRKLRPSSEEIQTRVHELLRLVQLEGLAKRYPGQLSGGQRQRVALARALAVQPRVLLLDEPFGALDARVRQELRRWLRRLHDELHITSVFVTHDQEEALELADSIVVMNQGRIEQVGTPGEVYDHPANPFVYKFLGSVNLFHGRVHGDTVRIGGFEACAPEHAETRDGPVLGYVRPHEMELERHRNGSAVIEAVVSYIHAIGPIVRLELKRHDNGDLFEAQLSKERYDELSLQVGDAVFARPRNLRVFAPDPVTGDKAHRLEPGYNEPSNYQI
ncbi:MAG: sulfate/molybdate ABC transporter ATP-binding protein [Chloroflexota bacterium]|nr:MAG: sulfate/molybdate ABC transporter ATP-binding protein [Chloroflexota bacterium]